MAAHFLSAVVAGGPDGFVLVNERTGRIVADVIETAFDSRSRRLGLLERQRVPDRTVLIIAPCNAVHTFGMRMAIDIVFVARNGTVVKIREAMAPRRVVGAWRGFATCELAAGALSACGGVIAGDRLVIERMGG